MQLRAVVYFCGCKMGYAYGAGMSEYQSLIRLTPMVNVMTIRKLQLVRSSQFAPFFILGYHYLIKIILYYSYLLAPFIIGKQCLHLIQSCCFHVQTVPNSLNCDHLTLTSPRRKGFRPLSLVCRLKLYKL